jgi:Ca-activated chloride channel family protein
MTTAATAILEPVGEARIALESVDIQATLQGLISEVVVTQTYRNLESSNIEAVYTFPLPLDAVLLDLTVELNGKLMRGVVQPRANAEERYEDAIEDGDSALLLQKVEPGLFTINVGNILPNEQAVVQFRYALLHRWQGNSLRLHLPTTIAPRYGDPIAGGLAAHQAPEYALTVDHGFSLVIRVEGELAQTNFECPSHLLKIEMNNGVRELSLSGGSALMDRDFILVVKEPSDSPIEALWEQDNEAYVALASFHPVLFSDMPESPRCVKLVVDCSGSMGGDSIAQAKVALHEILSLLKTKDHFNLITFGSSYKLLFPKPVNATEGNIRMAALFVEQIDANMGGTEIGAALEAAFHSGTVAGLPSDLLLITDGEVWNHDQIVTSAQKSGHRIFSVGVGSAVSEAFVRRIAESTSGACELVSPRENMSERIVRHFKRIDQPRANAVRVEWSEVPVCQIPTKLETVYAGDTLHVFGWFNKLPEGNVGLVMTFEDGRVVTQEVPLSKEFSNSEKESVSLARVAAHTLLQTLDDDEAADLAVRYQLVTEYTSCVLVFDRDEGQKAEDIPALRKVPQVLAAGWGAMGTVSSCDMLMEPSLMSRRSVSASISKTSLLDMNMDYLDFPAFLRREETNDFTRLVAGLNDLYSDISAAHLDIDNVNELVAVGLDQEIADQLLELIADGFDEVSMVVCFLAELSNSEFGKDLTRHVARLIRKANKKNVVSVAVADAVSRLINGD